MPTTATTDRFVGEIAGFGTASGHQLVVGRWTWTPFGPFADVMHEDPAGHRTLRAPTDQVAEFVATTYVFDEVVVAPVDTRRDPQFLLVRSGDLGLRIDTGGRTPLGWALQLVPDRIARAPWWCTLVDPVARLTLAGVRTCGTAGNGRREWYGAGDQHRLARVQAVLAGDDLGPMTEVWPPVRFGFSSTPRRPGIVSVTTTVHW